MSSSTLDDEEKLLRDIGEKKVLSLERALLILAGLQTEEEILTYEQKINNIFSLFIQKITNINLSKHFKPPAYLHKIIAKSIFDYLWNSKPKRFGEHFLLTDVIDAQVNPDVHRSVGTCVGLTSLFSVLGLRGGLNLSLLASSDHLLNRLRVGEQTIDIDHTDPQGFACVDREGFREFPLPTLTANVLNSRGLKQEQSGNFRAARSDYEKAVRANPEYANAYNNRGNMKFAEGDMAEAIADYTEAIRLQPGFYEAYGNRGMAKQRLGLHEEARQDYRMAVSLRSEYGDAHKCLQALEEIGMVGRRPFSQPTESPAEPTWEKGHNIRFLLT